jgi:hypothetical protein
MQKEDARGHLPLPARVETSMSKCPISRALVEVTSPQPLNDAVPNGTRVTGYAEVIPGEAIRVITSCLPTIHPVSSALHLPQALDQREAVPSGFGVAVRASYPQSLPGLKFAHARMSCNW